MALITSTSVAAQWAAKVPAAGGSWTGFDAHEWFASYAEASARDRAEIDFLGFEEFMADEGHDVEDLQNDLEIKRIALMKHFGEILAITLKVPIGPWVSEVLERVSTAYLGRISELLLTDRVEARA